VNIFDCRPLLTAQDCAREKLSSRVCQFSEQVADHPRVIRLQQQVAVAQTAVNFVCRENVDGAHALSYSSLIGLILRQH